MLIDFRRFSVTYINIHFPTTILISNSGSIESIGHFARGVPNLIKTFTFLFYLSVNKFRFNNRHGKLEKYTFKNVYSKYLKLYLSIIKINYDFFLYFNSLQINLQYCPFVPCIGIKRYTCSICLIIFCWKLSISQIFWGDFIHYS